MTGFALATTIIAVLALFAWAGASTRASRLAEHLDEARRLLRLERERHAACHRPTARIIEFPSDSRGHGERPTPDSAA